MRAVHAYKRLKANEEHIFNLLVWKLSVIRNKNLGFTTVLYSVPEDKNYLEQKHILDLYDEVYFVSDPRLNSIDLIQFWAAFKFVALEAELYKNLDDFFMLDIDLVLMDDSILKLFSVNDVLVWANTEPAKVYPSLHIISRPANFVFPNYFNPLIRPVNTAIIYIKNKRIINDWLQLAWCFMQNNPISNVHNNVSLMVTAEQRFLPNVIRGKYNEKISFYLSDGRINFGKEHFHVWGKKHIIVQVDKIAISWISGLLGIIKQENAAEYERIIDTTNKYIKEALLLPSSKICKELLPYIHQG